MWTEVSGLVSPPSAGAYLKGHGHGVSQVHVLLSEQAVCITSSMKHLPDSGLEELARTEVTLSTQQTRWSLGCHPAPR